eukprot:TRINITY_DN1152_c0_g1_i4.p1 TRINITY_DN1152_c0_g1~~TRINITY_DN1152_c0_g1_i4.p1  ORF type:complete len:943 (+),score=262.91 TRINITY_DN1152_c0_g1_i4:375-2831(+)
MKGCFFELEGDAQDYFGKGLSGATLAVYPPKACVEAGFVAEENILIGNTSLYGATSGACFVNGIAGERFAVRNSGAWAVCEGAGDHCCEYMTGGRVVVLGKFGENFGAGFSGGVVWLWNPERDFEKRNALAGVEVTRVDASKPHADYENNVTDLKLMLDSHLRFTGSAVAKKILARWPACAGEFVQCFPDDFIKAVRTGKAEGKPSLLVSIEELLPKPGTDKGVVREPAQKSRRRSNSFDTVAQKPQLTPKERKSAAQYLGMTPDIEDSNAMMKGSRPKTVANAAKVTAKGKGFKAYDRAELPKRAVEERVSDFIEILDKKDIDTIQTQAGRCMDCGTPFCHQSVTDRSGCPLGNLIPEWNELVLKGAWHQAFKRLMQTNNFPEFTGRVCPAPCEGACVLGIIDDPVSIKSVELTIIDKAYEMGWMKPSPPPFRTGKTVAIIGSGPAGLATADQLNKMGHSVTVYERADRIGGLMMYGVPNMKADKKDVIQRRVDIMAKEGIVFKTGRAGHVGGVQSDVQADAAGSSLDMGPTAQELLDQTDAVVLSVGATVARDLNRVPGRDAKGVHLAMEFLTKNTKALLDGGNVGKSWRQWWGKSKDGAPPPIDAKGKNVIVIGGGDTGNDCIGTSVRHGAKRVINLELMPRPPNERGANNPWPHWPVVFKVDYGHEEAAPLNSNEDIREYGVSTKEFLTDGQGNLTGLKIVSVKWEKKDGQMRMVEVPGSEKILEAELCLLALGFLGPEAPLAEQFSIDMDDRGNYKAAYDKKNGDFQTSNEKVFACGDCRRGQSLVVWAIKEGRDAADEVNRYLLSKMETNNP